MAVIIPGGDEATLALTNLNQNQREYQVVISPCGGMLSRKLF